VLDGPGLCTINHGSTGATELLTGKHHHGDPNYSRLSYHSHLTWEADAPAATGGTAQTLGLRDLRPDQTPVPAIAVDARASAGYEPISEVWWGGWSDGALYRQVRLGRSNLPGHPRADLADIPVARGVLRIVRPRIHHPYELELGHYGVPHLGAAANYSERRVRGRTALLVRGRGVRLALVLLTGWQTARAVVQTGTNAEAETSTVPVAVRREERAFSGMPCCAALLLHALDDRDWSEDELLPVDPACCDSCDGRWLEPLQVAGARIDFDGIDGRVSL
jgi:hypothetical protein